MTVTTEATIEVAISEFHNAVRAVLPHADRAKLGDTDLILARVRATAGRDELLLTATNGRTAALAAVPILNDSRTERFAADDGEFTVDLHPKILRDLQAGLTAAKDDGELIGEAEITLTGPGTAGPGTIEVTDIGGLWVGSSTKRPVLPLSEQFPDVVAALRGALAAAEGVFKPLVTDGPDLAAFAAAAKAYERPLQVEPVGQAGQRGWLVLCGPSFAGTLTGGHGDDDSLRRRESWRRRHEERLGLTLAIDDLPAPREAGQPQLASV